MKSEQFINILKQAYKYNLKLDFNQVTKLSSLESETVERIFEKYNMCDLANRQYFLEILLNEEFITYHGYERILDIIANLSKEDLSGIKYMLSKKDAIHIPNLMDYINLYYNLTIKPYMAYSLDNIMEISKIIPEVEYDSDANSLKTIILERFDCVYNHYVTDIDVFFFEDYDGVLESEIAKLYKFKSKKQKISADKLVRKLIKKGHMEEPQPQIIIFPEKK